MLRSHFGLESNPFDTKEITLLKNQQEVLETINVHSQQGGFCVLAGEVTRNNIFSLDFSEKR